MGLLKSIGIGFLVLFVIGIIGIALMPMPDYESSETESTPKLAEQLITTPTIEMLPTSDELPTEFKRGSIKNISLTNENKTIIVPGSEFGISKYKVIMNMPTDVVEITFYVFNFPNTTFAKAYYNNEINKVKSKGGYTEVKISTDANCFSRKTEWSYDYGYGGSICNKKNIVFKVDVTTHNSWTEQPDGYLKDMTKLMDRKVR